MKRIIITINDGFGLVDWVRTDSNEPVEIMIRNLNTEGWPDEVITEGIGDKFNPAYVRVESQVPNDAEQKIAFDEIWNHFKPKE